MLFGWKQKNKTSAKFPRISYHSTIRDSELCLTRNVIDLNDLCIIRSRVAVVIDDSVSMASAFNFGIVQKLLNRIFPLVLKIDDNLELEVFLFNKHCIRLEISMIMGNYRNFINHEIIQKGLGPSKGTEYASFIDETVAYYDNGSSDPAFIIVITDCNNKDYAEARKAIRKSSECPIFYQFININDQSEQSHEFDNLQGRKINNTAFIKYQDIATLSDDELYCRLLESYPQWLKSMNLI